MLPPDVRWEQRQPGDGYTAGLYCGKKVVALVDQRLNGTWFSVANRHAPVSRWLTASCANQAQGQRWINRWASKQVERLRLEPDATSSLGYWQPLETD